MPLDSHAHRLTQRLTKARRNAFARGRRDRARAGELAALVEENLRLRRELENLRRRHDAKATRVPDAA